MQMRTTASIMYTGVFMCTRQNKMYTHEKIGILQILTICAKIES